MSHDVVVLGGGAAGLSAALTLARSRRSVLVIDAGRPRNAPAAHAHGLLGSENRPPLELLDQGRRDATATVLAHTVTFDAERTEELGARGIAVVPGEVTRVVTEGDRLVGVSTVTTDLVPLDALVVATRLTARVDVLSGLGLETEDVAMGDQVVGTRVVTDATGRTSVPGVWAAGNVTDVSAQLSHSAAAGQTAAAQINADLVAEETRLAVEAARSAR